MTQVRDAGEIRLYGNRVSWTLGDLHYSCPQQVNTLIRSPRFSYLDREWELWLLPYGYPYPETESWVAMNLSNYTDNTQFRVRFGVVGNRGDDMMSANAEHVGRSHRLLKFIQGSELHSKRNDLLRPGGDLEIFCEILPVEGGDAERDGKVGVKEEKKSDAANSYSSKTISTQTENDFGLEKLLEDFRELLRSGENSDLALHVGSREFQVHRNILAARSPVFSAMVKHEMKEKVTGIVTIKDSDPDTFSKFLQYLYTGSVENLTSEDVLGVYETADKYQVDELKRACVKHMLSNISIENFCAVMTLSLRYHEKELTDATTQFFIQNSTDITISVQWQEFLLKNPVACNELFIKALAVLKK